MARIRSPVAPLNKHNKQRLSEEEISRRAVLPEVEAVDNKLPEYTKHHAGEKEFKVEVRQM